MTGGRKFSVLTEIPSPVHALAASRCGIRGMLDPLVLSPAKMIQGSTGVSAKSL